MCCILDMAITMDCNIIRTVCIMGCRPIICSIINIPKALIHMLAAAFRSSREDQ